MAIEKYVLPRENDESLPKLQVHFLRAVINEFLSGNKTALECRTELETHLGVTLSTDERTDLTNIVNYINGGAALENKIVRADESYRVFLLAESGASWYNTREKIRTRLSLIDDTI